ncbi:MAG: apolipoprotein N-acyltransferase [Candidatus Cloacimonadaceae bacterium]
MKYRPLIFTIISVLMLSLARLPLHLGFLVFIGWIPVMKVLRDGVSHPLRLLMMGFVWSLLYCGIVFYWIAQVTSPGLVGIILLYTLQLWLVFWAIQRIWQRIPSLGYLAFVAFIISFEYLQNFGETRFPWWDTGYSLADYLYLIQAVDLGGMSLLLLLILLVNILLERLVQKRWRYAIPLLLLFAMWLGYGYYRTRTIELQQHDIQIHVMQPSIPQEDKWDEMHYKDTVQRFKRLSEVAAADSAQLIIWPEAAVPAYLRYDMRARLDVMDIVHDTGLEIFTGFPDFEPSPPEHFDDAYYYNAASLFTPDYDVRHPVFHKNILVPVGERMLWIKYLPFLAKLQFGQANWEFGTQLEYYESHGKRFSPSICYELAFAHINHRMALPKDEVTGKIDKMDFLANLTNDGWFGTSYGPWLHQVMTRYRAVENRIQIYRSANTGISVIVDPLGRELASAPLFKITNIKAPLYTCTTIPLIRHIHIYPFVFVYIALMLLVASFIIPKAKEKST